MQIYLGVIIGVLLGPRFQKSKTQKSRTEKILDSFKQSKEPVSLKNWNWYYQLSMGLVIAGIPLGVFMTMWLFPKLQALIGPSEGLLYLNNGHYLVAIMSVVLFPILIQLLSYLSTFLVPSLKQYYAAKSVLERLQFLGKKDWPKKKEKRWEQLELIASTYDLNKASLFNIHTTLRIFAFLAILGSIALSLGLNSFTHISDDGIRTSHIHEFTVRSYTFDEVDKVHIFVEVENDDSLSPQIRIEFNDGKSVDIWQFGPINQGTEFLLKGIAIMKENDVFVLTDSYANLSILRDSKQEEVNAILNPQSSINEFIEEGSLLDQMINGDF